jgi:phospholipid/cholesterol/gamma-HCH transport system substrate-binding protein
MNRESKVGLLLAVAGVILVFGIFLVGDQEGVWKSKYELKIYYSNVYGLLPGAPVRLAGLRVGSVKDIEFPEAEPGKLEVVISIDKSVKSRIRSDSRALIGSLGLLGDKTIEITVGSPDSVMLEDGGVLQAGKVTSIEAIISEGGDLVENIREASKSFKQIMDKINRGEGSLGLFVNDPSIYFDLDKLLVITEKLSRELETGTGSFAKFVKDSTFYVELTGFLSTTKDLIDTLSAGQGTIPRLLNDPEPYQNLESIIGDWEKITAEIRSGKGTAGKLLTQDSLYIQLNRTLDRTEALLEDLREHPGRYVKFSIF